MRKFLLLTLLFSMAFSTMVISHNAPTSSDIFEIAKEQLRIYHERSDLIGSKDREFKAIDPSLESYMRRKINTNRYVTKSSNSIIENYLLNFELLSSEDFDNHTLLTIKITADFNYVGMSEQSGYLRTAEMVFAKDSGGYTLVDWYTNGDYYDEHVRGVAYSYHELTGGVVSKQLLSRSLSILQDEVEELVFNNIAEWM